MYPKIQKIHLIKIKFYWYSFEAKGCFTTNIQGIAKNSRDLNKRRRKGKDYDGAFIQVLSRKHFASVIPLRGNRINSENFAEFVYKEGGYFIACFFIKSIKSTDSISLICQQTPTV